MDRQARYDAMLVAIPVLLGFGGAATAVVNGAAAIIAAFVSVATAAGAVGRALFVAPPTEPAT